MPDSKETSIAYAAFSPLAYVFLPAPGAEELCRVINILQGVQLVNTLMEEDTNDIDEGRAIPTVNRQSSLT